MWSTGLVRDGSGTAAASLVVTDPADADDAGQSWSTVS
jgi:hypothetical protein